MGFNNEFLWKTITSNFNFDRKRKKSKILERLKIFTLLKKYNIFLKIFFIY